MKSWVRLVLGWVDPMLDVGLGAVGKASGVCDILSRPFARGE
jgi:hypothetical protein